jgi:hypothetical protein
VVIDTGPKNTTNEDAFQSERRSALKKQLTEPTLLEMSGYPTNQQLAAGFLLRSRKKERWEMNLRRPHRVRCSFAVDALMKGASPNQIASWLGDTATRERRQEQREGARMQSDAVYLMENPIEPYLSTEAPTFHVPGLSGVRNQSR